MITAVRKGLHLTRLAGASQSSTITSITTTSRVLHSLRETIVPQPLSSPLASVCTRTGTPPSEHHHHHETLSRLFSTTSSTCGSSHQPGRLKRFIKKMGWLDHSQSKLKRSGFLLYESACGNALTSDFFQVCDLPDTFYSFFVVTEIHVWMLMARLMAEGEEGRFTRNAMVEAMWQDCEQRSKKLGAATLSVRQEQIQNLGSSFQAALFSYDEGLMTSDCVLASALWRRLFARQCDDPERLECVIHFIRRQMALLDTMTRDDLLLECKVVWVPLLEQDSP